MAVSILLMLSSVVQPAPEAQPAPETATLDSSHQDTTLAPSVQIYRAAQNGVVQIRSGLSHGTGFLIHHSEAGQLVLTNDHVLSKGGSVSIVIDSTTRVPGQVVVRGRDEDLALARVHPDACQTCEPLPMVSFSEFDRQVRPGTEVVALGFPLSQPLSITSGIVAAVRPGAIISDVNLNSGNSGGPLLDMSGRVVAVNTFREQGEGGPGISGSIPVTRLEPLLDRAADSLPRMSPPPKTRLPTMPSRSFRVSELRAVADALSIDSYNERMSERDVGDFLIRVRTPVSHFMAVREYSREIGSERRERERAAGVPEDELFSAFEPYRSWVRYLGNVTRPAVTVEVVPNTTEKFLSIVARALAGAGQAQYKFKGDVGDVQLYRNGQLVRPVKGGERVNPVFVDNPVMALHEVVGQGYHVYRPEVFRPDSTGRPPSIVLAIQDLKDPDDQYEDRYELPPGLVARVWNDFVELHERRDSVDAVVRSDSAAFRSLCDDQERWPDTWTGRPWRQDTIPDWKQPELVREAEPIPFCQEM